MNSPPNKSPRDDSVLPSLLELLGANVTEAAAGTLSLADRLEEIEALLFKMAGRSLDDGFARLGAEINTVANMLGYLRPLIDAPRSPIDSIPGLRSLLEILTEDDSMNSICARMILEGEKPKQVDEKSPPRSNLVQSESARDVGDPCPECGQRVGTAHLFSCPKVEGYPASYEVQA